MLTLTRFAHEAGYAANPDPRSAIHLIPDTRTGYPIALLTLVHNLDGCRRFFRQATTAGRRAEARFWLSLAIGYRAAIEAWHRDSHAPARRRTWPPATEPPF